MTDVEAALVAKAEQLAASVEHLAASNEALAAAREHYRTLYLQALEQIRKLEVGILGPKAERVPANDAQLTMSVLEMLLGRAPTPEPPASRNVVREHERAKPTGRKPLPESLPRVEIEIVPPEVDREGRNAFEQIGAEVSETIVTGRAM